MKYSELLLFTAFQLLNRDVLRFLLRYVAVGVHVFYSRRKLVLFTFWNIVI